MKKLFVVLLTVVLLLAACTDPVITDSSSNNSSEDVSVVSSEDTSSESEILLSDGEYYNGLNDIFVKTDAKSATDEMKVTVINSVEALQNYYDSNKDLYDLEEFKTAISEFNEEYFEEKTIILVAFASGESCLRHALHSLEQKDGKLNITIADIRDTNDIPKNETKNFWHGIIKIDKTQLSTEKINVENLSTRDGWVNDAVLEIVDIQEEFFIGQDFDRVYTVYSKISHDYCVGDYILITFENSYWYVIQDAEPYARLTYCTALTAEPAEPKPNTATAKPVIYIYPTEKTDVTVKLDFNGRLGYTYPKYDGLWEVTAYPDGKLVDKEGRRYNTLFWDGWSDVRYDLSKGFCVKGEDTEEFLREKLAFLGLNEAETEEFLEFWLKWMEGNKYNIITFQDELYKETAKLTVYPEPDTTIRVFMAFTPSEEYVELEPQKLTPATRNGYTVVEWGGTMQ